MISESTAILLDIDTALRELREVFAHEQMQFEWKTIGGHPDGKGHQHAGGTPVKIGPGGEIAAGPSGLKGKTVDELKHEKSGAGRPGETAGGDVRQGQAPAVPQAAKPEEPPVDTKTGEEYRKSSHFKRAMNFALSPPEPTQKKSISHYIIGIPKQHGELMKRTLGTDKFRDLYAYRSPNRPLDFLSAGEIESGTKHLVIRGEGYTDDTLLTDKPLSPARIAGLELATMPHTNSQIALGTQLAESLAGGPSKPVEMVEGTDTDRPRGVLITPSVNVKGKWQMTRFDPLGFSGHEVFDTRKAAIEGAMREGFKPSDEGLLDDLARGDEWKRGAKIMKIKQYDDKLTSKNETFKDHGELMDVLHKEGPDAALKWIENHQKAQAQPAKTQPAEAKAQPEPEKTQPPATEPKPKAQPGIEYVRAPKGGAVSPVTGKHYKGGSWMPIHGKYVGQVKAPPKAEGEAQPKKPAEDQGGAPKTPWREPTPEEIQARREREANSRRSAEILASPLGRLLNWGRENMEGTITPKFTDPAAHPWRDLVESVGEEQLKKAAEKIRPMSDPEDIADELSHPQGITSLLSKKHHRENPSSREAYAIVKSALGRASMDDMAKIGKILAEAEAEKQKPRQPLIAAAKAKGFIPNRFNGVTSEGHRVKAGEGFVKKNERGEWITYSDDQVRKLV